MVLANDLIDRLSAGCDQLVELTSYRSADEEVAPYGTLDRDQLMEIKRRREEQLYGEKES